MGVFENWSLRRSKNGAVASQQSPSVLCLNAKPLLSVLRLLSDDTPLSNVSCWLQAAERVVMAWCH